MPVLKVIALEAVWTIIKEVETRWPVNVMAVEEVPAEILRKNNVPVPE